MECVLSAYLKIEKLPPRQSAALYAVCGATLIGSFAYDYFSEHYPDGWLQPTLEATKRLAASAVVHLQEGEDEDNGLEIPVEFFAIFSPH